MINSVAELDALPVGSVVRDREGDVATRRCPLCGWFIGRSGRCANEVPVQGGWLWEHR